MIRRKKGTADGQKMDPNIWMVTFSDLLMLMLTFFVLLLTMSSMDQKRLRGLFRHLQEATGLLEFSGYGRINSLANLINTYQEYDTKLVLDHDFLKDTFMPSIELEDEIRKPLRDVGELIDLRDDERGIVLSFQENILFAPGEVRIKKEGFPVLDIIATAIESCSNDILIMGHTDNTPIKNSIYESNWELSSYRALSVLEYFLKEKKLSPLRFYVGGYGPSRPLFPNNTWKNRALNRRVEIIFKHLSR